MPDKQTIALLNSNKTWGGGEKWHFDIASRLHCKGYSVLFIVHKNSELLQKVKQSDIPHIAVSINNFSFLNPFKRKAIERLFRKHRARAVIMNLPSDMKAAGPAAQKAGVEKIIYRRGTALPVHNNFYNRHLFKKTITHIITNSHETKNLLLQHNPHLVDQNKIRVIYNGLDFREFDNQPVYPVYHKKREELVLGNAGRFVEQKGHTLLVDVAKKLKHHGVPFRMLLAGEGKLKESIIKTAKKEGIYDCLIFTGFISDIKSFMASIDLFLLTSLWEGFGYVIVEAMAEKKPVIAFNISSNPEIIKDGQNGYLVPLQDTDAFVKRILTLYNNKNLREQMGYNARKSAIENFDIERTVRAIEELVREEGKRR